MPLTVFWSSLDWARAIAGMPAEGPLPCRTVVVPRERVAHVIRRELLRSGQPGALAGTRFLTPAAAAQGVLGAAGVHFTPGEEALRPARLAALFNAGLQLRHFSLDLLRTKPGWDEAFARTIGDLEGAALAPEDLEQEGMPARLRDVGAIWRAANESACASWTAERIYLETSRFLADRPDLWPFEGPVIATAHLGTTAAEAQFLRVIPGITIGLLAGRPVRSHYLDRMASLFGGEAARLLESAAAPRAAASERDLLASYLFEPPQVLADEARPRSGGPDGTADLEEHAVLTITKKRGIWDRPTGCRSTYR